MDVFKSLSTQQGNREKGGNPLFGFTGIDLPQARHNGRQQPCYEGRTPLYLHQLVVGFLQILLFFLQLVIGIGKPVGMFFKLLIVAV